MGGREVLPRTEATSLAISLCGSLGLGINEQRSAMGGGRELLFHDC